MEVINGLLTLLITTTLVYSIFGVVMKKKVYERVLSFSNLDATNIPLMSPSGVDNIQQCAQLCSEEQGCRYLRLYEGICSLFESTPHNSGKLQGAHFTISGDPCPISEGYISVSSPRMCFKLSEESIKKTWFDSQSECQRNGGRLFILNTLAKHDYLYQYLKRVGKRSAFVGMEKVDEVFKWTDGSDYVRQWEPGEPDYVSHQNCVRFNINGLMDTECDTERKYLCEIITSL